MRRQALVILGGLVMVWAATGCSQVAVYVEHDPRASFPDLATYQWLEQPSMASAPDVENPILDARVRSVVDAELAARGFEKQDDGTPDFLVGYTAAVDNAMQAVTIDRYYGYTQTTYLTRAGSARDYPRGTLGRQTVVYEYQQGSLILDISTPVPRRLIWRAYARSAVDPNETQETRDKRLREAVRKMLKDFPPGRAADTSRAR